MFSELGPLTSQNSAEEGADGRFARALLALLQAVAKWAMADVFVVALTILVLNGELLTAGDLEPGAVFYAASVLLSSLALMALPKVLRSRAKAFA